MDSRHTRYYGGVLKDGMVKLDYGVLTKIPASNGFTGMKGRKFSIRSIEVFPHTLEEIRLFEKSGELMQDRYLSYPEELGIIGHTGKGYLAIPQSLLSHIRVREDSKLAVIVSLHGDLSVLKEKDFFCFRELMPGSFLEYVGNTFGL